MMRMAANAGVRIREAPGSAGHRRQILRNPNEVYTDKAFAAAAAIIASAPTCLAARIDNAGDHHGSA